MSVKDELIKLLYFYSADYIPADTLARRLGISRSGVYKYIKELRREGYPICGCTNRGYALSVVEDTLSPEAIVRFYPMEQEKIRHFSSLPSTNTTAKEMAKCGAPEGTVCIADTQTKGRGRMHRSFFSPHQSGLYMSIVLRPNLQAEDALLITTLAAVSVAETIEKLTEQRAQIKWVNDVYLENKKVCGILTEAAFDAAGKISYAVLGIGVNVYPPAGGFPKDLEKIAGSVFASPMPSVRARMAAGILEHFFRGYRCLAKKEHLAAYQEKSFLTGKSITVMRGEETFPAVVLGIEEDFSLRILCADGQEKTLSSGEVSVKWKDTNQHE